MELSENHSIVESLEIINKNILTNQKAMLDLYTNIIAVESKIEILTEKVEYLIKPQKQKEKIIEYDDPNIKIRNQKTEYIYSTAIPGLKLGRVIKQDFEHVREE